MLHQDAAVVAKRRVSQPRGGPRGSAPSPPRGGSGPTRAAVPAGKVLLKLHCTPLCFLGLGPRDLSEADVCALSAHIPPFAAVSQQRRSAQVSSLLPGSLQGKRGGVMAEL